MEHSVDKADVETFIFLWLTDCIYRKALWLQTENYPVSLWAKLVLLALFTPTKYHKGMQSSRDQLSKVPSLGVRHAFFKPF